MMIEHEKTDALLAVAKAFYDRGPCVQYDQLSMDRLLRVTPRRRRMAAPEDATRQSTLFLDCSSFVWAAYYNAFGYALEADLSWEMIDMVKPRVFYYELTHRETEEERARMAEVIRELLCPGDVIIFEGGGNGHVMLYQGGESYINCTQAGRAGSYDYVARRDTRPEHGGIRIEDIAHLFAPCADKQLGRNYLFGEKVKRFCVLRPLARVGEPTENMRARLAGCRELACGVETSHPGGRTVGVGCIVEYTVHIRNLCRTETDATVEFAAPQGCTLLSAEYACLSIPRAAAAEARFRIQVEKMAGLWLAPPLVRVNGFKVASPRVLCGHTPSAAESACLVADVKAHLGAGMGAMEAAAEAYRARGISIPADVETALASLFYRHDSAAGDVLSRKPQAPAQDMAVYSYFGGYGVITPEAACNGGVRATGVRRAELQAGDLILCGDDARLRGAYACFFTGEALVGTFGADEGIRTAMGAELDAFLESLFGRFCFALLRPYLAD